MNIVIDQSVVEGYVETLAHYQKLLSDAFQQRDALAKREEENQLLSIEEACHYLKCSPETLLYYRRYGLDYYKKGRDGVWYRKGDINAWLNTGKVNRRIQP